MKKLTVDFTFEELGVLTSLASDQLFRRQFIDPKMPGYRENPEELELCKTVVGRLRTIIGTQKVARPEPAPLPKRRAAVGR